MPLSFTYPPDLPVSRERESILDALRAHQVVILCGDTGSGKTTQLPKMIAEALGPDVKGKIGVTQPRRLAALRMAARVAEECGVSLGGEVGVRVRFDDRTSRQTRIQFMTDGLLLAQLATDPEWRDYRAILIDEAHERSLNIDFLLGRLHQLLPRRKDLKVVISSATLDAERFSTFFGGAPVLQVEGRLHPIQDVFLPEGERDRPLADRVQDALLHLDRMAPGLDTLVFLPGEREIRDCTRKLTGSWGGDADVLPLFARLGGKDQDRAFRTGGRRRIILATNVAETSVTLPGIRAVIDTGSVRLQRFDPRLGVQRLVTEQVSRASSTQRRGRCGRTGPGICVRLYSEEDLEQAPAYVDPEIRRSSLAEVILRMAVLDLPFLNEFPLLDPPKGAAINQGFRTLVDLGAMDPGRTLTSRGRVLARFPLDPRLARMLEEGHEEHVLPAVLVAVAFLALQDPRERPSEKTEAADKAHAAWRDPGSDFLAVIHLWNAVSALPSQTRRNRFCRENFLHPGRIREWINLVDDLRETCGEQGWTVPGSIGELELQDADGFHRSLLAGVPRSVGQREENRSFRAPSGQLFQIFPGSGLAAKPPKWVMSFALVETSRLWARECAGLRPDWIEQVAPHLCKFHYERPVWNASRGFVEAEERAQFGSLTLRQGTRVHYGRVDPVTAREIFLEDGLLPANLPVKGERITAYRAFLDSLDLWERKLRQPGQFTRGPALLEYLEQVVPQEIFTAKAFGKWSRSADWVPTVGDLVPDGFRGSESLPDVVEVNGLHVGVAYRYAPEDPETDGVTFVVREEDLDRVPAELLEWTVPAWMEEKVTLLIRSLDKKLRARCAPVPQTAAEALAWMQEQGFVYTHSLTGALAAYLAARLDCILGAPDFSPDRLPPHLQSRLCIVDAEGVPRYEGGSLPTANPVPPTSTLVREPPLPEPYRGCFDRWPDTGLPETVRSGNRDLYLALEVHAGAIRFAGFPTEATAAAAHLEAMVSLFARRHPDVLRHLQRNFPLPTSHQLALSLMPSVGVNALEDVIQGVLRDSLRNASPFPRTREAFAAACDLTRAGVFDQTQRAADRLGTLLDRKAEISDLLDGLAEGPLKQDLAFQESVLWRPGWCADPDYLDRLPRYLKGMEVRMERAQRNPAKDQVKFHDLEPALDALAAVVDTLTAAHTREALMRIEELRLSVFAPEIRTRDKISVTRFLKWMEELKTAPRG